MHSPLLPYYQPIIVLYTTNNATSSSLCYIKIPQFYSYHYVNPRIRGGGLFNSLYLKQISIIGVFHIVDYLFSYKIY
jgi:hypothetical protein